MDPDRSTASARARTKARKTSSRQCARHTSPSAKSYPMGARPISILGRCDVVLNASSGSSVHSPRIGLASLLKRLGRWAWHLYDRKAMQEGLGQVRSLAGSHQPRPGLPQPIRPLWIDKTALPGDGTNRARGSSLSANRCVSANTTAKTGEAVATHAPQEVVNHPTKI